MNIVFNHKKCGQILPVLLLLFLAFSFGCTAQNKYDINDPRNPDCPCHKLQKIADEEFARLKKTDDQNNQRLPSSEIAIDKSLNKSRRNVDLPGSKKEKALIGMKRGYVVKRSRKTFGRKNTKYLRVRKEKLLCYKW
jgi:hypothetical protein